MFEYGDKDEYVREQASQLKGRNVQEAWGMNRGEREMDSNRTLLSDYLEEMTGLETPSSESQKHQRSVKLVFTGSSHNVRWIVPNISILNGKFNVFHNLGFLL